MTTWYPYPICYRCSIVTESVTVSPAVCEILSPKHIGATTHVTSFKTWPFDSPYAVSYWWSIETEPLSPSVRKLFDSKYTWVTTLTFWGHVTSMVMWPFDAQYSISYRHSIVTDSLSPAVFEILDPKHIGVTTNVDHVTIRFNIWGFLLVLHWNQVNISKRFRDIWLQIYRGHDLDVLGSRDVIGHVTIWCPI